MTATTAPEASALASPEDLLKEESARYALLRRIAPTLRHHLAGAMQPIGMVSAIMERRLQAAEPDLNVLRDNSKSISTLSRSAASASMSLITWVAPRENGKVSIHEGVEECAGMLATDLAFRGFTVTNTITPSDMATSVFALRSVFTAALIALTDTALVPATIVISSEAVDGHTRVLISVSSEPGAAAAEDPRAYRKLAWDDVQALASAEQVGLTHAADRVELYFMAAVNADVTV
ncbi:MAG: hypothetical protein Q8M91_15805 [Polaromonas sp.]|nr:hypothetical protein [Polaromonas sp.]MDP3412737.1 hypothetical protein [Polaromonas sp.]